MCKWDRIRSVLHPNPFFIFSMLPKLLLSHFLLQFPFLTSYRIFFNLNLTMQCLLCLDCSSFVDSFNLSHPVQFFPSSLVPDVNDSVVLVFHQETSIIFYFSSHCNVSYRSHLPSSKPMRMQAHHPLQGILHWFLHSSFLSFSSFHPN